MNMMIATVLCIINHVIVFQSAKRIDLVVAYFANKIPPSQYAFCIKYNSIILYYIDDIDVSNYNAEAHPLGGEFSRFFVYVSYAGVSLIDNLKTFGVDRIMKHVYSIKAIESSPELFEILAKNDYKKSYIPKRLHAMYDFYKL